MRCCPTPLLEVMLYVSGMLSVAFGIGALVVCIDPRPLDLATSRYFLHAGIGFLVLGAVLLVLTVLVPTGWCGGSENYAFSASVADLLSDVQSVGCLTPGVLHRGADLGVELGTSRDSLLTLRSCMMLKYPLSGSEGIRFYKETVI